MLNGKIPPYAKPLLTLQRSGHRPSNDIYLFIGPFAWHKGTIFSNAYPERVMILPAWQDPEEYFWPVRECGVLLFDTGWALDDYIDDVVACLFRDKAKKVFFIPKELGPLIIFNKEVKHVSH
jgi:hypothetical protein